MKYWLGASVLAAGTIAQVAADCSEDGGNWYCALVEAITYTNVGGKGSYNKITSMDSGSGACSSSAFGYSGSIAPLNEEVSMHFRGPIQISQFAAYMPGDSASAKRMAKRKEHRRRHAHAHGHAHAHAKDKRNAAVGDTVVATIDGQVVSWKNNWDGSGTVALTTSTSAAAAVAAATAASGAYTSDDSSSSDSSGSSGASGDWARTGYYNAQDGTADGIVFLNHFGGSGSGVFDYTFGNSLSYASSNGQGGSSSPQTLISTTLPSSAEVVIMTDQQCENGDCGFVRPGTVAYHGFDGPSKAFFYEFQMPDTGETAASQYDPVNMPAIWMLNAQIPNTLQYGNGDCSCWISGCGEFDIFEVLSPGSSKCKSTLHGNIAGGDSNWFSRPANSMQKAALIMYNDQIHIKYLDSDYDFPESMSESDIAQLAQSASTQNALTSIFSLASAGSGKRA